MADYITLLGAEDVRRAASQMSEAASTIQNAVSNITYALEQHQRFMDDWLSRQQAILERVVQNG